MADSSEKADLILSDPTVSHWLKDAITTSLKRDPVDAVNDAEILVMLLKERLQELLPTDEVGNGI